MIPLRSQALPARWRPWGLLLLAVWLCVPTPAHADETLRQVQEELRKRDLYFGDIDGRETPQVDAALRRYQERKGFASSGKPDETTLRSLNLLPALPLTAGVAAPTPSPVQIAATVPWPDITVLRSDEARRHLVAANNSPAPTAIPGPPPDAATASRLPTPDEVRAFLTRYLQAGQTNDTPGELAFYGDYVNYFDEGLVDHHFIEGDVSRYDRRWPHRQFTLLDPFSLTDAPDGDPAKVVVHFRYAFTNKGPRYTVEGKADNAFTLQRTGAGGFRILGMKEQRVREK